MRRYNSLYVVGFLMVCLLIYMANSIQSESAFFYGFAENKQTEISHDRDVLVSKIHVKNGQEISKGDLLLEVIDASIDLKLNDLQIEKESVAAVNSAKVVEINSRIEEIRALRNAEIIEVKSDIKELEEEIALNKSLYEGLKTIDKNNKIYRSPDLTKLNFLKENLKDIEKTLANEVRAQYRILNGIIKPRELKEKSIDAKLEYFKMQEGKLSIYAPFDGLVGTISCKEGENISSFSSLVDLYKHNPTQVKGFVHESMILEVSVGDKLEVSSTLHPDIKVIGEVIGLGSRIVEINERLRKIPEYKTYGREVVIEIPSRNSFLQKEKVILNISKKSSKKSSFGSLFSSASESRDYAKPSSKAD